MGLAPTRSVLLLVTVSLGSIGQADADGRKHRPHEGADPDDLLKSNGEKVVNGCGPEKTQLLNTWRFADDHTYNEGGYGRCELEPPSSPASCDGEIWNYQVSFRDACNLHDAGYEGELYRRVAGELLRQSLVYDKILDEDVDFSTMSREQIDERFLHDMEAECEQQIQQQPGNAPFAERAWRDALESCKHRGQGPSIGGSWGALTLWDAVRNFGNTSFRTLHGKRKADDTSCARDPKQRGCRFDLPKD